MLSISRLSARNHGSRYISRKFAFASHSLRVGLKVNVSVKFPLLVFQDIDQWNKVTELLGTPSESFLNQLQPSVSDKLPHCCL